LISNVGTWHFVDWTVTIVLECSALEHFGNSRYLSVFIAPVKAGLIWGVAVVVVLVACHLHLLLSNK